MALTLEETLSLEQKTVKALEKASTKEQVIAAWKTAYTSLGHKALGRMLVGTHDHDAWVTKQKSKGS